MSAVTSLRSFTTGVLPIASNTEFRTADGLAIEPLGVATGILLQFLLVDEMLGIIGLRPDVRCYSWRNGDWQPDGASRVRCLPGELVCGGVAAFGTGITGCSHAAAGALTRLIPACSVQEWRAANSLAAR